MPLRSRTPCGLCALCVRQNSTKSAKTFHLPFDGLKWHDALMNVFTYGSLMIPSVMVAVTGTHFQVSKAALRDYARFSLKGESYPAIVFKAGAATDGVLHRDVDERSLKLLDDFEGELYRRISVRVEVDQSGALMAEAYVISPAHRPLLSSEPWDFDEFKEEHLQAFLRNYRGFSTLRKDA